MLTVEDWIKDLQNFNPIVRKGDFVPYDENFWRKGWKHTDEAKKLMSEAKKRKAPWNKGVKLSPKKEEVEYRGKIFNSKQEAADYFGVSWKAVNGWVNRRKKGVKIPHAVPCYVRNKHFAMTKDAAEYFGVSRRTIRNWVLKESLDRGR